MSRYLLPHRDILGGSILDRNYDADIAENTRLLSLPACEVFGLSLTTDGATIQRHPPCSFASLLAWLLGCLGSVLCRATST